MCSIISGLVPSSEMRLTDHDSIFRDLFDEAAVLPCCEVEV